MRFDCMDDLRHNIIEKSLLFFTSKIEMNREKTIFDCIVQFVGEQLDVDYVFIDTCFEDNPNRIDRIAFYNRGVFLSHISYDSNNTPAKAIIGNQACSYNSGIQKIFPNDDLLKSMHADAYIGQPLWRACGNALGLVGVMHKSSVSDLKTVELVLQIVALRVSHDLEGRLIEDQLTKQKLEGEFFKRSEECLNCVLELAGNSIEDWNVQRDLLQLRTVLGSEDSRKMAAPEERKMIIKELIESRELFAALFRNSTMGLYQTTPEGKILFVNPAILEMLGFDSLEELLKRDLSKSGYVDENKRRGFKRILAEKGEVIGFESEWYTKDGEIIVVNEGARAIKNSHGEIIRYDGGVVNITDKKKVEQELVRAKEKAEESDRLKSTFLATMSHEFRTPLNAIIGFSGLINKDISLDEVVDYAEIINTSGYHLLKLIEDMFSLTLIESGQVAVQKESFELIPFLSDIWDVIKEEQHKTGKQDLTLIYNLHPKLANQQVKTDKTKLKHILINLLQNALKFTEEGFIEFVCLAEFAGDESQLRFYVKDTGIGIKDEDLKVIFEPFRQISYSDSRQTDGAGIGLSVSQRLSDLLGGSIVVESIIEKGSTFTFTLPLQLQESAFRSSKEKMPKMNWRGKTVLVAEDDSSNFELIKTFLRPTGITVIHAINGREAVDLCKIHNEIDLILMDRRMPVMDGFEATKIIKETNPDLPVIALTALTMRGDKEKALAFGCDDYISKPINIDILYRVLHKYLMKMIKV